MFSVMWSEHCSYKSSRPLLRDAADRRTGTWSPVRARTPAWSASATASAVAFKLESHNHPSAVEPYQGAATGVGGILRDIFTMGARPIAMLDALKFGDPATRRTRRLVRGVVRGVGGYGNCVGVPTVGGELVFHPELRRQPAGQRDGRRALLEERHLTRAAAPGPGNLAVLLRLDHGPRRHRRRVRPRQRHLRRGSAAQATERPGRRPVRREAAHRGQPRAHRARAWSRGSRTWARPASRAPRPRPPTAAARACASTWTPSRAARRAWRRSR